MCIWRAPTAYSWACEFALFQKSRIKPHGTEQQGEKCQSDMKANCSRVLWGGLVNHASWVSLLDDFMVKCKTLCCVWILIRQTLTFAVTNRSDNSLKVFTIFIIFIYYSRLKQKMLKLLFSTLKFSRHGISNFYCVENWWGPLWG